MNRPKISIVISTKDRYYSTLPLCLQSIINQTYSPDYLYIFDDGEQIDLRNIEVYKNLFSMMDVKNIKWQVIYGERKGQIFNYQKALDIVQTEWIWRIDDDEVAENDFLEKTILLLKDNIGAVSGLILDPKNIKFLPKEISFNKIENIFSEPNIQWFRQGSAVKEVEHLYSSFLFRKEAAIHGFCLQLSQVGHREETIFTHEMFRNKWKLLVNPEAVIWHYRNDQGGIRSNSDGSNFEHDEQIFINKLKEWEVYKNTKIIVLNNGLGDHLAFCNILPDIIEKYKDIVLAVCYPEVFEPYNVKLISIADAKNLYGNDLDRFSIYKWMWDNNWKTSMVDAYKEMYL